MSGRLLTINRLPETALVKILMQTNRELYKRANKQGKSFMTKKDFLDVAKVFSELDIRFRWYLYENEGMIILDCKATDVRISYMYGSIKVADRNYLDNYCEYSIQSKLQLVNLINEYTIYK